MSEIIETSDGKSDGINNLKFCARKAELKFAIFGILITSPTSESIKSSSLPV